MGSIYEKDRREPHEMISERQEILARLEGESNTVYLVGDKREVTGPTRLEIDFASPAAMWDWLADAKTKSLPLFVSIYEKDSLDKISDSNTFIVKQTGARDEAFRLTAHTTSKEE